MQIKLPDVLSIVTAADLRTALLAALGENDVVELDGAEVDSVDLSALQLLSAAQKSAARLGKTFSFAEGRRSEVIDLAASKAGLHDPPGSPTGALFDAVAQQVAS